MPWMLDSSPQEFRISGSGVGSEELRQCEGFLGFRRGEVALAVVVHASCHKLYRTGANPKRGILAPYLAPEPSTLLALKPATSPKGSVDILAVPLLTLAVRTRFRV